MTMIYRRMIQQQLCGFNQPASQKAIGGHIITPAVLHLKLYLW